MRALDLLFPSNRKTFFRPCPCAEETLHRSRGGDRAGPHDSVAGEEAEDVNMRDEPGMEGGVP